jgi:hypothetical protein
MAIVVSYLSIVTAVDIAVNLLVPHWQTPSSGLRLSGWHANNVPFSISDFIV